MSSEEYELLIEDVWPLGARAIVVGRHTGADIHAGDHVEVFDGDALVVSTTRVGPIDDHPPGKNAIWIGDFGVDKRLRVGQRLVGRRP